MFREAYEKYALEGQSYREFLQAELEVQMDIIRDSSDRAHHLVGPLELAFKLATELVETP